VDASEKSKIRAAIAALGALTVVFAVAGIAGRDFGRHWDEGRIFRPAHEAILSGSLIPHAHAYPAFAFDVYLASLAPTVLLDGRAAAAELALAPDHRLRVRALFVLLTACAIPWAFWAARAAGADRGAALFAAGAMALSFELSYHSRWVVTDAVAMQFGALCLALALHALARPDERRWIVLAGAAAGLAAATKYNAGIVILTPMAAILATPSLAPAERLRRAASVGFAAALVFLLVSPGTAIEWRAFLAQARQESAHYASGHGGHSVAPGLEHAGRIVVYLATQLFSPWMPAAIALFGASLLGLVRLVRERPRAAAVLLVAALVYLAFMSTRAVMIVRNLLLVAPVLAVGLAFGLSSGLEILARLAPRPPLGRAALRGAVVALGLAQAAFLVHAGRDTAAFDETQMLDRFLAGIAGTPERPIHVSRQIRMLASEGRSQLPAHARHAEADADDHAILMSEVVRILNAWPANVPGRYESFGPADVNFDYYPDWTGRDRVVLVPEEAWARLRGALKGPR